jgi:hypothetical protein
MRIMRVMKKLGRYLVNVLISLDQLGNSILAGDPDETISSRLGRIKVKWGGKIPKTRPVSWLVDKILDWIDPGHSVDAIEPDEGDGGIYDNR